MNTSSEKLAFASRLKERLALREWPLNSPTWLAREFNIRYSGSPVSVQAASNWLSGTAIPSQEKLQVLASWLEVSSQWLRFGAEEQKSLIREEMAAYGGVNHSTEDLPAKLARLNPRQKQAIRYVVDAMLDDKKK